MHPHTYSPLPTDTHPHATPRCSFYSTLFLRAAKMSKALGSGSLSSLLVIPGTPATGQMKRIDMSKYQTLSEEQKAKIQVRVGCGGLHTHRRCGTRGLQARCAAWRHASSHPQLPSWQPCTALQTSAPLQRRL